MPIKLSPCAMDILQRLYRELCIASSVVPVVRDEPVLPVSSRTLHSGKSGDLLRYCASVRSSEPTSARTTSLT